MCAVVRGGKKRPLGREMYVDFHFKPLLPACYAQGIVKSDADGYRDYDTVNVNLILPHITSIVPNPVSQNTVTVHFSRPDSSIVQLLVANAYSPSETIGIYPVSMGAGSSNIDITSFPQGVYSVSLMVDGVVTDTKNFIRVQ